MDQDIYQEDLADLIENVLLPLEKYFSSLIDIGYDDREPRRLFIDDIGQTGIALVSHAQDELRTAVRHLYDKVGKVTVRRATPDNRLGVRPRKILEVDLGGESDEARPGWAKQ